MFNLINTCTIKSRSLLSLGTWLVAAPRMPKRLMDVILSGIILFALAPIMALIAALIRLDSPGAILFQQLRVGKGGRTFKILKFRTMVLDAEARMVDLETLNEAASGAPFRIENDPRVT